MYTPVAIAAIPWATPYAITSPVSVKIGNLSISHFSYTHPAIIKAVSNTLAIAPATISKALAISAPIA